MKKIFLCLITLCSLSYSQEKHVIGARSVGFFSNFLAVLNHLTWCDKHNKIPVVFWDKTIFYYEPNGYNGSFNAWEYYFKPVSAACYKPEDKINRNYDAPDGFYITWRPQNITLNYKPEFRKYMNSLIEKYIYLNPLVENKINEFYLENMTGKKTIGVHIRGTDKYLEAPRIPVQKFIDQINKFTDYQVLIATDEQKIIDELVQKLHKPVIYYDAQRSTSNKPLHRNNAKIGEDVLIEAQLLSRCDIFIHSVSNVSTAVLFFNPTLEHIFIQ